MHRPQRDAHANRHYYVGPHPNVFLPDRDTRNQCADEQDLPEILLTTTDLQRLLRLIDGASPNIAAAARFLVREVDRARVVPPMAMPAEVVTMRSQVRFRYDNIPQIHEATLLYPEDSGRYERKLSVLTPLGAALLGLFEGQTIRFAQENGGLHSVSVVEVPFQPEAQRMYWL